MHDASSMTTWFDQTEVEELECRVEVIKVAHPEQNARKAQEWSGVQILSAV